MARAWLIDSRGLASKVKNATLPGACQEDCGANRECPNCHQIIDNSDVSIEWPGFPLGVKFEPSDMEMLQHLAAKCGVGNVIPHKLIDVFIPTLDGDDGIYYTHPEHLPGSKKDGSSVYFFYRTTNAYATGQRKRRKIQACEEGSSFEQVRWHKTGKTKILKENGLQKGCKKIMVLYSTAKRGCKPDKSNWVMHQYHLGSNEEERDGDYVVSRIFYQQNKVNEDSETPVKVEDMELSNVGLDVSKTSPRTPMTVAYEPPRRAADYTPSLVDMEFFNLGLNVSKTSPRTPMTVAYEPPRTAGHTPSLEDMELSNVGFEVFRASPRTPMTVAYEPPRAADPTPSLEDMDFFNVGFEVSRASPRTPMTVAFEPPRAADTPSLEDMELVNVGLDVSRSGPRTPKTVAFEPPRAADTPSLEDMELVNVGLDVLDYTAYFKESEAPNLNDVEAFLLCDENMNSSSRANAVGQNGSQLTALPATTNADPSSSSAVAELDNLVLDSQPDFLLNELYYGSQDSFGSWLEKY